MFLLTCYIINNITRLCDGCIFSSSYYNLRCLLWLFVPYYYFISSVYMLKVIKKKIYIPNHFVSVAYIRFSFFFFKFHCSLPANIFLLLLKMIMRTT